MRRRRPSCIRDACTATPISFAALQRDDELDLGIRPSPLSFSHRRARSPNCLLWHCCLGILSRRRPSENLAAVPSAGRSVRLGHVLVRCMGDGPLATNEALAPSASWWPPRAATPRPWSDLTKRQRTVPPEQSDALDKTKAAVLRATVKLVADVAHEGLAIAVDALEFVPIPGVAKLAGVLLLIWDTVQGVESNRLACLRLTELAAEMLSRVRNEIDAAGQDVLEVLDEPLRSLHEAFKRVLHIVQKQAQRPFLKRYLKREEDERKIDHCRDALQAAMNSYQLSIQTRALQHILKVESTLYSSLGLLSPSSSSSCVTLTPTPPTPRAAGPAHLSSRFAVDPARVQADAALDRADMEARIREALAQGTDAALFALLQVPVHELPEAQWAMRRALEGMSSRPTDKGDQNFFHVEFMESSIDAMARLSDYRAVPTYTVTKYELDRDARIGLGSFAEVFKGTWRNSTVAIKILSPVTPQDAFRREIEIWRMLKHTHVLPLWGASSPDSGTPYFFVSPYMANGALPGYLHRVRPPAPERMRMMHEIVLGMVYLHSRSVLHGDLKAANVLVDDQLRCIIADFGQSEVKSEVLRLTGKAPPHGTLRWLPPELMDGEGVLTAEADVYSFAICCVEVMTCGQVPWVMIHDDNVRNLVINFDKRPMLPETDDAHLLERHLGLWWARDPRRRPAFASISVEFNRLRNLPPSSQAVDFVDPPKTPRAHNQRPSIMSPPLQPIPIPPALQGIPVPQGSRQQQVSNGLGLEGVPQSGSASSDSFYSALSHHRQSDVESSDGHSIRTSFSMSTETQETELDDWSGPQSPPPQDVAARFRRDERRYRLRLLHNFHPSLKLPLWVPTKVHVGAVGYIDKNRGTFITLFNVYNPWQHAHNGSRPLPSLCDYGRVPKIGAQPRDDRERPAGRPRAWSFLSGMTFLNSQVPHGPKFNLHAGRKEAFLFTEQSVYRYMEEVNTARDWFAANIGTIMEAYGAKHKLQREDICLIIGALDASDWAMFVSHNSPGAVVHLQIKPEAERKPGQPWAAFVEEAPDKKSPPGPSYPDDHTVPVSTNRVSLKDPVPRDAEHWDTMLVARLRFMVDQAVPTSL